MPKITLASKDYVNKKYSKPESGIPKDDLSNNVQESLNKADSAIQSHQDISGKVDKIEGYSLISKSDLAQISTNKDNISKLGGNGSGSIDDMINARINEWAAKLTDDGIVNTYAEAIQWIAEHGSEYTELLGDVFNKVDKVSGKGLSTNDLTTVLKNNYDAAYMHSQTSHARADATNVEKSNMNGNIKINGTETTVYTHPTGTNPHGTTKSDIGLGNVGNFKSVSTVANQELTETEKTNARNNINASSFSGDYNDLSNKPTIPSVITESTVIDWGFAKSTDVYQKPLNGIPKDDLSSDVQSSLDKADSALPLSGGTMTGSIILPKDNLNGIFPDTDNYGSIGSSDKKLYRIYAAAFYGDLLGSATKLNSSSCKTITIDVADWMENNEGNGYQHPMSFYPSMPYTNFSIDVLLSSDQSAAKLQLESWNYIMADGMIEQSTSNGSTNGFTFRAFNTKPTVTLTVVIQGVS